MPHRPAVPQVLSSAVDGSDQQLLAHLAPVTPPRYSWTVPGGCDQLSLTLSRSPRWRTAALDPGRLLEVILGGSVVWRGRQLEPKPGDGGWEITGQGSGTYGSLFQAEFPVTGGWAANTPDTAVNRAISRGLPWVNPGVGSTPGIYGGQPNDAAAVKIDDMLNQCCTGGGLTWLVSCTSRGDVLSMFALPSAPNRYLIAADPVSRTLGGDINRIWLRYQSAPDISAKFPAAFANTSVDDSASQAKHGVTEEYEDLASSGTMTAGNAQAVGNAILSRYQRASFSEPFTVEWGQLLNMGGQPVELGAFYSAECSPAMVCRALLADYGLGGEVKRGAVTFLVGAYEYDAAVGAASVTPFQGMRTDFAALASWRISRVKPRHTWVQWKTRAAWRHGHIRGVKTPVWHFGRRPRPPHHGRWTHRRGRF